MKPEYIQSIETKEGVLSVLNIGDSSYNFYNFFFDNKIEIVYSDMSLNDDMKYQIKNVIYKTTHGFYFYFEKKSSGNFDLTIYYHQKSINELKLFVNQITKKLKNATTNNRTT